ncbi:helix-turn-helix domain-containing protein [Pedobacter zeae]|uniref:Excisionase family DNA binding protein n=1 Tax=Pedobacter zeae TaxID=1737356 RepID=A0A7W6KB01_9SPHI|nr:helix-turn-helix domain-containing protein [Pedobacter zeae]MBB4108325.1 excisionase family DNA binding protein [Pedobacter zeae]GGG93532.1 hypothetical protein GCM10007422_03480 [Pedobacter zeae]
MEKPNIAIIDNVLIETLIASIMDFEKLVLNKLEELNAFNRPYLTLQEACKLLNRSTKWMMAHKHEIGCSRVGRDWIFKRKDIDSFFNQGYFKK